MDIAVGTVINIHLARADEGELHVSVNDREVLGAEAKTTPREAGGVAVVIRIEALREGRATFLMKWNDELPMTHDFRVVPVDQAVEISAALRDMRSELVAREPGMQHMAVKKSR